MLTVDISKHHGVGGERIMLSYWPSEAGVLPDGDFDDDAWEASQTFLAAMPGVPAREAFRVAYRMARIEARKHGGLEFFNTLIDEEPCHLPDLTPAALVVPAVIVDDGGPSYRTRAKLSGEQLLEMGRLLWLEQLGHVRDLVNEAIEKGKNFAEFEAGMKAIFPAGIGGTL